MGRQSLLLCGQFGRSVAITLLLVLGNSCLAQGEDTIYYDQLDMDALQAIFAAWNKIPDQSSNLYGWNKSQIFPCQNLRGEDVTYPNWRGVQCLRKNFTTDAEGSSSSNVVVVSLSLSNALIVGTLPPAVANLTWLTTLELTGNPNLTGPLPEIQGSWISVLDLHDNGFNGDIPQWTHFWPLLQLDLSGNQFTGQYPVNPFSAMHYLQVLSIGNNRLTGPIPSYASTNKTEVVTLDLSNNRFTGQLPDLSPMQKLMYLDVSGNEFVGSLPDLRSFPALQTVNLGYNNFFWTGDLHDTFNLNAQVSTLDLSGNNLTGGLPPWNSAGYLGTLQELYLNNNSLSGALDLIQMNDLQLLLTNSDPNSDPNSTLKLSLLSLSNNKISLVKYDAFSVVNIRTVINF